MSEILASVYIICQDEVQHIRRVLESVKDFDEVIIVDSGSKDETLEIAKEYTDKIYHQKWLGFAAQKEYAKNLCTNEWVLNLDADEQVTPELKNEIKETINANSIDGLDIKISSRFLGTFNHPLSKFNRRIRFFKKAKGYYPKKLVHESIVLDGSIKKADAFILDYGIVNIETQVKKINNYSSLRAEEKQKKGKQASVVKLITIFPFAFFKSFILKRGFLNGIRGFIAATNNSYYAFLKEAKLYEKNSMEKER